MPSRLLRLALLTLLLGAPGAGGAEPAAPPARIVSMNPSLTAILVALGATPQLVGVDEFSARQQPAVASLPRVGGLYNPSLEAVAALRPDLVVLVPSVEQRAFRARLAELGIPMLALDPLRFDEVLDTIVTLGDAVGRGARARQRVAEIEALRARVRALTRDLPRPRVVLVIQREPLFVVGRGSFVDEMLGIVGAENLGARFDEPYPRVSLEWLVAQAPEVILDSAPDPEAGRAFWQRWPSLPAVRHGRVVPIPEQRVTLPGPDLDRGLLELLAAVHGREWAARARATP